MCGKKWNEMQNGKKCIEQKSIENEISKAKCKQ